MTTYYTPTIEEFHMGFESEIFTLNGWKHEVCDEELLVLNVKQFKTNHIRVKHLDREDIESFGWKADVYIQTTTHNIYDKGGYTLLHYGESNEIEIQFYDTEGGMRVLFEGTIRNKSELKTLMGFLHINQRGPA